MGMGGMGRGAIMDSDSQGVYPQIQATNPEWSETLVRKPDNSSSSNYTLPARFIPSHLAQSMHGIEKTYRCTSGPMNERVHRAGCVVVDHGRDRGDVETSGRNIRTNDDGTALRILQGLDRFEAGPLRRGRGRKCKSINKTKQQQNEP
jgi:hypothetical protein